MKRALIFDPYVDTLGGGERYVLTFALGLIKEGYSVEMAWKEESTLQLATSRFGLDFSAITVNQTAHRTCTSGSFMERLLLTSSYDLVFWVSDGSVPFLFSKNNLLHLQVPFMRLGGHPLINTIKYLFIHKFVYNSEFTRAIMEKVLPKSKGMVLYPPIDTEIFKSAEKKEKIILSVARFDSPSHPKRQDILVEALRHLHKSKKDYRLVLAGGLKGDLSSIKELRDAAKGLPVDLVINPSFPELKALYGRAKFFWHAAGFGVDETVNPEKVEHFGMTTVEAMSAGCVPIVIRKGGQKEIVTSDTGALCDTPEEMAKETDKLIEDDKMRKNFSENAVKRADKYSLDSFFRILFKICKR